MLTAHCLLYGNAYAEVRPGPSGAVSELWPLHPSRMKVEQLEDGSLRYCYREQNGRETIYRQDQIFHLRWLSNDGVMGMLPITLSRDAIALAQALETHGGAYFGNACRLSGLMESDNPITVETAERLREQFERMHRGRIVPTARQSFRKACTGRTCRARTRPANSWRPANIK
jgi:HK97 family phage portal protein